MRILKSHPLLRQVNSYLVDSPQPSNISYAWNFGSLLAFCLIIQIITGVTLAMHYNPSVMEAFNSVEHIMRDVNNGWLIRYLHSNTASAFFFLVYLHIGRGLYYGSYKAPRTLVWTIGTVIFILMMATAFLGYVLPYGQMSLWGATVITNLMSAIPWIGQDIVEFIWGGFSVSNATLNRFFSLHFVLPFILAALALMHLITLHDSAGSGNPLGISGNYDRLPFSPYFIFKDLITIFIFILALSILVFFMPNVLGDSENYVMANPMQTPPAIVPEWYLLPFYAILRSIPNKLLGVIAMFSAILILLVMPFTDLSRSRGIQFRPISKAIFFIFIVNFLILLVLGAKHVESPFIEFGQISTLLYFSHFILIIPLVTVLENTLTQLATRGERNVSYNSIFNNLSLPKLQLTNRYVPEIQISHSSLLGQHVFDLSLLYKKIMSYTNNSVFMHKGKTCRLAGLICFYSTFALYVCQYNIVETLCNDAPRPWGLYFQDSGTPQMEGLVELHDDILFYLVMILFAVGWILTSILSINKNSSAVISNKYMGHGTFVELVWTVTPAFILILIAFPSFKLLYLMDEVSDPAMAVLAEGHQWYWSYQYPDFINNDMEFIEFDSYLVPESDLQEGALRMLEVDNRLILPELTHVRFIITAADVIHSFACPSLGIKCDAYPGRLNQVSVMFNRSGTFYGQCSEICGILHSSMPITIECIDINKFVSWLTLSIFPFNIISCVSHTNILAVKRYVYGCILCVCEKLFFNFIVKSKFYKLVLSKLKDTVVYTKQKHPFVAFIMFSFQRFMGNHPELCNFIYSLVSSTLTFTSVYRLFQINSIATLCMLSISLITVVTSLYYIWNNKQFLKNHPYLRVIIIMIHIMLLGFILYMIGLVFINLGTNNTSSDKGNSKTNRKPSDPKGPNSDNNFGESPRGKKRRAESPLDEASSKRSHDDDLDLSASEKRYADIHNYSREEVRSFKDYIQRNLPNNLDQPDKKLHTYSKVKNDWVNKYGYLESSQANEECYSDSSQANEKYYEVSSLLDAASLSDKWHEAIAKDNSNPMHNQRNHIDIINFIGGNITNYNEKNCYIGMTPKQSKRTHGFYTRENMQLFARECDKYNEYVAKGMYIGKKATHRFGKCKR